MIDLRGYMVSSMAATAMGTNQRRSAMMMEDYRGQMVDESAAIESAMVEIVEHDPLSCDCEDKIDRIIELMDKGTFTADECNEMEQLSSELLRSIVIV